jgi:hypothetical protein
MIQITGQCKLSSYVNELRSQEPNEDFYEEGNEQEMVRRYFDELCLSI